jgi:hypothetical protein
MTIPDPRPKQRAECIYCIHAQLSLYAGAVACTSEDAHRDEGEEKIREYLAGGDHNCPHFEDDELPW